MNFSDRVKCDGCKSIELRGHTLIVENAKGKFRMCRTCFAAYSERKLNQEYHDAKDEVGKFSIDNVTDAYDIIKKKEKFIKSIKEGGYGS